MTRIAKNNVPPAAGVINPTAAGHVLWYYGYFGYGNRPSNYFLSLINTIQGADKENRDLLSRSYPEHVAAVHLMATDNTALEVLTDLFEEK